MLHTRDTMDRLGGNGLNALNLHHQSLLRLQDGCAAVPGKFCYSVRQHVNAINSYEDVSVGLNLGYGFSKHFAAGAVVDYTLHRDLPSSHHDRRNDVATGVYALLRQNADGNGWYLKPAVSFNSYDLRIHRPMLSGTEAGEGETRLKGSSYSLTGGQNFALEDGKNAGWYVAVRHSDVRRKAYTEHDNIDFPVRYSEMRLKDTAAVLGGQISVPLSGKLHWRVATEIEQSLDTDNPAYTAEADFIGRVHREAEVKKTRVQFGTGLRYDLAPRLNVTLDGYVGRGLLGGTSWGTALRLNGEF